MARQVSTLTARTRQTSALTARSRDASSGSWPEFEGYPSVIFVLLDDVGINLYDIYDTQNQWVDPHYAATPWLDALAVDGVTYDRCYAAPVCSPTRAQVLTGRYPHIHDDHEGTGVGFAITENSTYALPATSYTMPQVLAATRADTPKVAIGKYHLTGGYTVFEDWPVSQHGWDEYHGMMWNPGSADGGYYTFNKTDDSGSGASTSEETGAFLTTDEYEDAKAFVEAQTSPFLLYWATHAIHSKLDEVTDDAGPGSLDLTDTFTEAEQDAGNTTHRRAISHLEAIDVLLNELEDQIPAALADDVMWVVMGDNGTAERVLTPVADPFWGNTNEPGADYNLDHTKGTAYEEGIRVPLVIAGSRIPTAVKNTRCTQLVDCVDIYPTILDLISPRWREYLEDQGKLDEVDGISLIPTLYGGSTSREYILAGKFAPNGATVSAESGSDRAAIKVSSDGTGHWKLRRYDPGTGVTWELYQIGPGASHGFAADPLEATDLIAQVGVDSDVTAEHTLLLAWYNEQLGTA